MDLVVPLFVCVCFCIFDFDFDFLCLWLCLCLCLFLCLWLCLFLCLFLCLWLCLCLCVSDRRDLDWHGFGCSPLLAFNEFTNLAGFSLLPTTLELTIHWSKKLLWVILGFFSLTNFGKIVQFSCGPCKIVLLSLNWTLSHPYLWSDSLHHLKMMWKIWKGGWWEESKICTV